MRKLLVRSARLLQPAHRPDRLSLRISSESPRAAIGVDKIMMGSTAQRPCTMTRNYPGWMFQSPIPNAGADIFRGSSSSFSRPPAAHRRSDDTSLTIRTRRAIGKRRSDAFPKRSTSTRLLGRVQERPSAAVSRSRSVNPTPARADCCYWHGRLVALAPKAQLPTIVRTTVATALRHDPQGHEEAGIALRLGLP